MIDHGDVLRVRRRILVANEDRGLVMAVAMVDHGPKAPAPTKKKKSRRNAPAAPAPALSTDLMGVIFKMSDGRITRIEAIELPVANDAALGWAP
jgi:hypothetical protein